MKTTSQSRNISSNHTVALCAIFGSMLAVYAASSYAVSPVTQYEYDANGNMTKVTNGLGIATTYNYDALNRRTQENQPNPTGTGQLGQVKSEYNAINQVTKVTDPRTLATNYTYDALGNVLSLVSPDTGTTTNTYDIAGNVLTKTDAKGQITTYSYDTLNRVTSITYSDSSQVTYTYDQGTYGKGFLTGITDSTGSITYTHDIRGRVVSEARTISGIVYTTTHAYNSAGKLTGVAYPTGLILSYTYDTMGRISQINATKNGQSQIIASNISYQSFGGIKSLTFGSNANYTRSFDTDGRITSYSLGPQTIALTYDLASRITALTDAANSSDTRTYAYDNIGRLTTYSSTAANQGYGYDLTGNRTSLVIGGNSYNYTNAATSNQLISTAGPAPANTYTYDANGSPTTDGVNQYTYDKRGRLTQVVTPSATNTYGVNSLGQRVVKTAAGVTTVFHYDQGGQLIAETDAAGNTKREIIYLQNIPIAIMK